MQTKQVNSDVNGNPRIVVHFLDLLTQHERDSITGQDRIWKMYDLAISKSKKFGGKKFHNSQFGGGVVFQASSNSEILNLVERVKQYGNNKNIND